MQVIAQGPTGLASLQNCGTNCGDSTDQLSGVGAAKSRRQYSGGGQLWGGQDSDIGHSP